MDTLVWLVRFGVVRFIAYRLVPSVRRLVKAVWFGFVDSLNLRKHRRTGLIFDTSRDILAFLAALSLVGVMGC